MFMPSDYIGKVNINNEGNVGQYFAQGVLTKSLRCIVQCFHTGSSHPWENTDLCTVLLFAHFLVTNNFTPAI